MPCHSIGHQVLPIQPLSREAEDFPRVSILKLLAISLINSSGLEFKHVKIMNSFTYGEEFR